MSEDVAFSTPTTFTSSVRVILRSALSLDLTDSTLPSSFSIVPRTRTVCCAAAEATAMATNATAAAMRTADRVMGVFPSHRRGDAAPDVDRGRLQRAVRLLGRAEDDDVRAGLELGLLARRIGDDRGARRHDHLLLAFAVARLVFD